MTRKVIDPFIPHYVYEAYGSGGDALYVGMTNEITRRLARHFRSSDWASTVEIFKVTRYASRPDALTAEREATARLRPLHNRVNNPDVREARREHQARTTALRIERMAADHSADPDCAYHRTRECRPCHDELNALIG